MPSMEGLISLQQRDGCGEEGSIRNVFNSDFSWRVHMKKRKSPDGFLKINSGIFFAPVTDLKEKNSYFSSSKNFKLINKSNGLGWGR